MTDLRTVYMTAPDEATAARLARKLLELRLIACANVLPAVRSWYRWEGDVHDDAEVALLCKTRAELLPELQREAALLHPYDVPCIVAWPIASGHEPYLDWVRQETGS
ncbi:MAG: divalent-cation tolerance protein CutA [Trueperaceae bacterium]